MKQELTRWQKQSMLWFALFGIMAVISVMFRLIYAEIFTLTMLIIVTISLRLNIEADFIVRNLRRQ